MGTVVVRRRPRTAAPDIPRGELQLEAPPEISTASGSRLRGALMLLPMLAGTAASAMMFAGRQAGAYSYVVGAIFGVSSLGMLATGLGSFGSGAKRAELVAARRDYLHHLRLLRTQVRETGLAQRRGLYYRHPDPDSLWSLVDSYRLWERRPADSDFAVVRVGRGTQTLATPLVPPQSRSVSSLDPVTADALHRFLDTHATVPDLPVALSLRKFARIFVSGQRDAARSWVRALIAQLAFAHAPEDLLVAACIAEQQRPAWDYLKWLPHVQHPSRTDGTGPIRLVANEVPELERLLDDVVAGRGRFDLAGSGCRPHVAVILDGGEPGGSARLTSDGGLDGVTVIDLDHAPPWVPERGSITLTVGDDGSFTIVSADRDPVSGMADGLNQASAEALARQLAPLRLPGGAHSAGDRSPAAELDLTELLGIADPWRLDLTRVWASRPARDRLRVPIGVGVDGVPVQLDLKESALGGMGPHGLLIGATGSGKSELLRTIVLGLAATHDSRTLNFVLIDFKGGATFASLDRLPHTAAVITNLADELPLVDRTTDALNGELVRRQELLREAGNLANIHAYEQARAGSRLPPLPELLIVCDEFSELLAAKPEFIDLFVQIGRLGRSLGVHLLLASQRLEEGRLRGLETHLSYRIGLRTFSAMESRTVLGVPDAYELPPAPGHGYLRYGTDAPVRFTAAFVSGPAPAPAGPSSSATTDTPLVLDFTTRSLMPPVPRLPVTSEPSSGRTMLDVVVAQLDGAGLPAHQVWLPPLAVASTLDELMGPLVTDPALGITVVAPALRGQLSVAVALVDRPFKQRRDPLWLRLSGSTGHVAVVGGPQSGKSSLLCTLVIALAVSHTPRQVQCYCLDFGGGGLSVLRDLPHVGGVAARQDRAAVHRTVAEISALLAERERGSQRDEYGEVFLLVDGWSTVRTDFDDLESVITDLATRGLSYGIHIVASASRWMDFRPGLRDLFGTRLELRLGEVSDSMVSRKAASNVPERSPGRGLTSDGEQFLAALPTVHSIGTAELVRGIASAWFGPTAPPVRLLPSSVPYDTIESAPVDGFNIPIGLAELDLRPARLDLAADPHVLVFGEAVSGKSSFLRTLVASISRRYSPEQARIVLVDYRRSLLDAVRTEHLIGTGTARDSTADLIASVAAYMRGRLPGPDLTIEQLATRSWWSGPDCFVVVDDYDLVATGSANPLLPLLDYLAQARDIGLHLILARRSGGAGRALYEPVIQRLRELSCAGLVLAGDPDEGPLLGNVRPQPMPPGRGMLVTRRYGARLVQLAEPPA